VPAKRIKRDHPGAGQLDKALPNPPSKLVRREEAHSYPTDFNEMSTDWINRLSLRGEQLTTCLARAYIPHLIDDGAPTNGECAS
jgi:NTE family protein